ncbi:MAG TPA: sigma 54-interacting transcriptional regulator [Chitinophagaceae bacterium]|nr:sigma 54-interacting transcriptional regulator [Chitinophagaceae bacterium]
MKEKVLIVEDQFVEADYLRLMLVQAGYQVSGIARSVPIAQEMIEQDKPDLVLVDIFLKGKLTGIDLAKQLKEDNIAFVYLSANSNEEILAEAKATQPYGFLVKPFREKDLLVTLEIARYRHEHSLETSFRKEAILQQQLADIISAAGSWEQKLLKISTALQPYIPFDYIAAGFNTIGKIPCHGVSFLRLGYDEYQKIGINELLTITGLSMPEIITLAEATVTDTTAVLYNGHAFEKICREPSLKKLFANTFQIRSHLSLPVHLSTKKPFSFCLYSRRSDTYNPDHIALYSRLQQVFNNSIENMLNSEDESKEVVTRLNEEVDTMSGHLNERQGFEGIIGRSHLLLNVFDEITQVAPSDTSVLIMGESGTGKERIADCIHNLSLRKGKPFIKVNCAALPTNLIESELFGHEKGSFTGAFEKRIGKFEQADKGSIFLDEIGEMPIELQVKLLRVLQEKEIERIGSKAPIKVNVRIIAATNRNLEKEVAEGRFRLDLYYRLNVFPIILPSLRERKEDIPSLVSHFINYYNRKTAKKITGISDKILKNMLDYSWPGNIRELEHMIERSVLLTKGTTIESIALPIEKKEKQAVEDVRIKTIHENERDHILAVLKKCNGRIWGPGAAAEILNIPPSTLKSRMKKLGIKKEYIE